MDQKRHDASTGFNDITTLPEFRGAESQSPTLWLLLALASLLVLAYLRKRNQKPIPQPKPDPLEAALNDINLLVKEVKVCKPEKLSQLASKLSQLIRRYIQTQEKIPAENLTVAELTNSLKEKLAKKQTPVSAEQQTALEQTLSEILCYCADLGFRPSADLDDQEAEKLNLMETCQQAEQAIKTLEQIARREAKHSQTVIGLGQEEDQSRTET